MKISNRIESMLTLALAIMLLIAVADPAMAQAVTGGTVRTQVSTFVCQILGIVNVTGLAIVTIAIFVFGYQVGFGGKRPAEAAPVLIGGLIIGIAGTLAQFFVPGGTTCP